MGVKYKKLALKKMQSMPSKQQRRSLEHTSNLLLDSDDGTQHQKFTNRMYDETIRREKSPNSFIGGIIAGLCTTLLIIFSFPSILSFYRDNKYSSSYLKSSEARLTNITNFDFPYHVHDTEDKILANQLHKDIRVLCWIMTNPDNHETKAQYVKKTWGPRCNKLLFMSSAEDTKLGTVALPVAEGREELWAKTKEAFKYVYKHHLDEYDWFMKADDDTYVVVENLRKMLYAYSPDFPIYFGCKFNVIVKQGYMHGGAGYVLSKEALKRLIEKGLPDETKCRQDHGGMEDVEMAKCMENLEVLAGDSREDNERARMFQFRPAEQLLPERMGTWYWSNFWYKSDQGRDLCCADHAISFHYIVGIQMNVLDYLIYHLRPFGITSPTNILPDKKSLDELKIVLSLPSINNNTT